MAMRPALTPLIPRKVTERSKESVTSGENGILFAHHLSTPQPPLPLLGVRAVF